MPTITIGIPAFNEAANIGLLLADIKKQKTPNFRIKNIIVSSDGSTDATNKIVRKFKKVRLFANTDRKGLGRGLNQVIAHADTDILIIFNADIRLSDPFTISKLASEVMYDNDLVSCPIVNEPPRTYMAKTLATSMALKEVLFRVIRNGVNPYTCHGPARAFSAKFYKQLFFPVSVGEDMYSYFACIEKGCKYSYITSTYVQYKLPETFADHKKQSLRFFSVYDYMSQFFKKETVNTEFSIKPSNYLHAGIFALPIVKNQPGHVMLYLVMVVFIKFLSLFVSKSAQAWVISSSSKTFATKYA